LGRDEQKPEGKDTRRYTEEKETVRSEQKGAGPEKKKNRLQRKRSQKFNESNKTGDRYKTTETEQFKETTR
jgi:hypothetical protein